MRRPRLSTEGQLPLFPPSFTDDRVPAPVEAAAAHSSSDGIDCFLSDPASARPDGLMFLRLSGRDYPCRIRRRRGRMNLRLDGASVVLGCAPSDSYASLSAFVRHSKGWLIRQISSSVDFHPPRDARGRAQMMIAGRLCPVLLLDKGTAASAPGYTRAKVFLRGGVVYLSGSQPGQASQALLDWLRDHTRCRVNRILPAWAALIGARYGQVRVGHYKGQWGSCRRGDGSGYNLSFNARLSMMPDWVWSYVLVHELCHCRIFDHSEKFWRLLDKYCLRLLHCTSREARDWLEHNDALLRLDIACFVERLFRQDPL